MRLVWFEVNGFKRFASSSRMNVDGKLIAIVGPNEGGKTSLLDALEHHNHGDAFITEGPMQETTRDREFNPGHCVSTAMYLIEDEDRESISEIFEAADVRWFSETKKIHQGDFTFSLIPEPKRNLAPRQSALAEVTRHKECLEHGIEVPDEGIVPRVDMESLLGILSSDEQTLDSTAIDEIDLYAENIEKHCANNQLDHYGHIPNMLRDLKERESKKHPNLLAKEILLKRLPKFLKFTVDDRSLSSEYNVHNFFMDKQQKNRATPEIPQSVQNLAEACKLDLKSLFDAIGVQDQGKIESLLDDANENLKELMRVSWSQSTVTVRFRLNHNTLHILVGNRAEQFVQIAARSEGMRQFIALLMFLSKESILDVKPILLIDEIEQHLHYDAQADLVQMLARQDVASKTIYTTHSIGCLPEDLGNGVRLVEQTESSHSVINNWFWDSDVPGFSSLLFGMGASTLAFIPVRHAVVTEGAADLLLLPTMFREASNKLFLGFQVAPGLSKASDNDLALLDREALRTIYLTDGDEAGNKIRNKIIRAGIPVERVLQLPRISGEETVIEDYLSDEIYAHAVNLELDRSHGMAFRVSPDDIATPNRPRALAVWCESRNIREPRKRAVAYHVLESVHDFQFLRADTKDELARLLTEINELLDRGS